MIPKVKHELRGIRQSASLVLKSALKTMCFTLKENQVNTDALQPSLAYLN